MTVTWILVAHIAVLGYWLGSELVINSTYRYVSYSGEMPFGERQRLMEHVMHVDQQFLWSVEGGTGVTALAALTSAMKLVAPRLCAFARAQRRSPRSHRGPGRLAR